MSLQVSHDVASPSLERNESSAKETKREAVVTEQGTDFRVWNPPKGSSTSIRRDLPDSYFEPTAAELKASYQAQVRAREALVNAPLKTREMRERENMSKLSRWPTTTIRIRFPDRTQLERVFPSTDKIRSVYAFVHNSLRDDVKSAKFVLYQTPPRREFKVSDVKVRNLTLFELQFSPSSVLLLSFQDESLNDVNLRPPLLESILAQAQDLPPPPVFDDPSLDQNEGKPLKNKSSPSSGDSPNKGLPKWLKIGKKT